MKTKQFTKKLDWKFTKQLMIKWKINSYAYELELSSEMKIHSTFHVSLLQLSKNNLISRQVSSLQFMIVENKEDSYFVDSIDNMKWNMKFTWFELLIKWEEYKQKTWKSYTTIKKNTLILIKKFHQNHSSQSALTEWVKEENQWLLSKHESQKQLDRIIQKTTLFWNNIWSARNECKQLIWHEECEENFSRISDVNEKYCNRTDFVSRYDDSVEHLSWILIST